MFLCFDIEWGEGRRSGLSLTQCSMVSRSLCKMFPYFTQGTVVKGFGRGSKQLGIPTANFPNNVIEALPKEFDRGIYYGWAKVGDGSVTKMVMSIGWNPYYKNEVKSMETHVIHEFKADFYGSLLKVCIVGWIRAECSFSSLDELIAAIHSDIRVSEEKLELPENKALMKDTFFVDPS